MSMNVTSGMWAYVAAAACICVPFCPVANYFTTLAPLLLSLHIQRAIAGSAPASTPLSVAPPRRLCERRAYGGVAGCALSRRARVGGGSHPIQLYFPAPFPLSSQRTAATKAHATTRALSGIVYGANLPLSWVVVVVLCHNDSRAGLCIERGGGWW